MFDKTAAPRSMIYDIPQAACVAGGAGNGGRVTSPTPALYTAYARSFAGYSSVFGFWVLCSAYPRLCCGMPRATGSRITKPTRSPFSTT